MVTAKEKGSQRLSVCQERFSPGGFATFSNVMLIRLTVR
jgi:hypothetical protein